MTIDLLTISFGLVAIVLLAVGIIFRSDLTTLEGRRTVLLKGHSTRPH